MSIDASYNFRKVTDSLTTSGIVHPDELKALRSQGYEVVVNLLPDTSEHAVPDERKLVESQGIEYVHIPVDFTQPTSADFLTFSGTLDRVHKKKVHVHCAANYRVSAFYSLYLVSREVWNAEQAMEFVRSIWQPSEYPVWSEFISGTLAQFSTHRGIQTDRGAG